MSRPKLFSTFSSTVNQRSLLLAHWQAFLLPFWRLSRFTVRHSNRSRCLSPEKFYLLLTIYHKIYERFRFNFFPFSQVKESVVTVEKEKFYSLELRGPLLPHTMPSLCHLMTSSNLEQFSVSCAHVNSTTSFSRAGYARSELGYVFHFYLFSIYPFAHFFLLSMHCWNVILAKFQANLIERISILIGTFPREKTEKKKT